MEDGKGRADPPGHPGAGHGPGQPPRAWRESASDSLAEELGLSKSGLFAHFGSKESLQVEILRFAAERFVENVVRPALAQPRGEPRVRAIFERWIAWDRSHSVPGGCLFVAAASRARRSARPGP
jgi:AcrR family transcriptional regulator